MNCFSKVRVLLAGLAVSLVLACQTAPAPPPESPVRELAVADETLLQVLARHHSRIHSVKSFVKTRINAPLISQTLRQSILARNDQSIRLDTLSAFGQPLGVFIFKPGRIQIYDPQKDRLVTGAEAWYTMSDMFGTSFDFAEFISVFLGKVPRFEKLEVRTIRSEGTPSRYVLDTFDPVRRERYRIGVDPRTLHPVELTKYKNGDKVYDVIWSKAEWVGEVFFPHRITVRRIEQGDEVILNYRNPEVNPVIPDESFDLGFPRTPAP